jgi:hypothetical protein
MQTPKWLKHGGRIYGRELLEIPESQRRAENKSLQPSKKSVDKDAAKIYNKNVPPKRRAAGKKAAAGAGAPALNLENFIV